MRARFFTKALRLAGVGLLFLCAGWTILSPGARTLALPAVCNAAAPVAGHGTALATEAPIEVPLPRIDRRFRNDARSLMDSPTLVRRLPTRTFIADRKTYEYLLDHLPVASRLADLLDFAYYRVVEMEDGRLHGEDFQGVNGDVWLIYSDSNRRVYIGEGTYDTWYTPKISAKVLLAVEYSELGASPRPGGGGETGGGAGAAGGAPVRAQARWPERAGAGAPPPIATRVDIYVSTNRLVGYLMELLGRVTDKKLSQLVSSAQYTSQELSRRPSEVWGRMKDSGMFTPEELESVRLTLLTPAGD